MTINNHFDIIIIGAGMAGLYTAYKLKKKYPKTRFLILEKNKEKYIGGRARNEFFYGSEITVGAGIGRLEKDKLLYNLLRCLKFKIKKFDVTIRYSKLVTQIDINKIMKLLRKEYVKYMDINTGNNNHGVKHITFKKFAKKILGKELYKKFLISNSYTDYEDEDAEETLYYYGMDDNNGVVKAFHVPWSKLALKLMDFIGKKNIHFSSAVDKINHSQLGSYKFTVSTVNGVSYLSNKIIIATNIEGVKKLLPKYSIYKGINGQPFSRVYGKFSKKSIPIMKEYVKGFTLLPGILQKIFPVNEDKGIYSIAYNDNKNTYALKKYFKNTKHNRNVFCRLLEKALGIKSGSLKLNALRTYYWNIGTHYYKPLDISKYKSRIDFMQKAQRPEHGIYVVGELISRNQGWVEGALESVEAIFDKKFSKD